MSEPASSPQEIVIRLELDVTPMLLAAIMGLGQRLATFILAPGGESMPGPAAEAATREAPRASPAAPPAAATRSQPAPVSAATASHERYRTEARAALVRELWPAGVPTSEIARRLGVLPGQPVPTPVNKRIGIWAAALGVKRPDGTRMPFQRNAAPEPGKPAPTADLPEPEPDDVPEALGAPAAAAPACGPAPVPQPPLTAPVRPAPAAASPVIPRPTWTPERTALARRDYPIVQVRTADLLAKINGLPGAPISEAWLHTYAVTALKLSRRPDAPRQPEASPAPSAVRRAVAREAIESWCTGRGWRFERFDIDAINRRCAGIGHPGFDVLQPSRRGAAA